MKKLLIYSGGMDSTVLLHLMKNEIGLAVNFNYGGKHNAKEVQRAIQNCNELGIELLLIDIPFVNQWFKSDLLTSGGDIPEGHYEDLSMKRTVVPFRNGIMLSIAVGLAESHGMDGVLIANHAGDHAIYPDCRDDFIQAMSGAAKAGTYNNVEIFAPFTFKTKRDIAIIGRDLGLDFTKTYSCYKGGDVHCGKCGTCVERREALEGFDPTQYQEG